ncbi:dTDP-4-dehydrorhamnose reductase [Amycolatopsis sp.]|uniref:dTDP-4-dehydrorhamnose reductase n=1 Tax=Amycolatopsis sp. TaxID=37632 RepID=UPI002DFF9F2A|nr:dTDP-4-dehydrorhamnose reductase [Amycolatopsis sp.]
MPLTVLVPGGTGQLGRDLFALAGEGVEVLAPGSAELDLTKTSDVLEAVKDLVARAEQAGSKPVVINAAAYTAVDAAEDDEDRAFAVNADGPRVLAAACSSWRVPLVHVSTDYVFAGDRSGADAVPYEPSDPIAPRSAYGRTKAAGEDAVLGSGAQAWVVRTAWVYGSTGKNFVKTMVRLEGERETLSVVDDQRGSPTLSADLAAGLLELAKLITDGKAPEQRVLHATGGGNTTWFGFTRAIFTALGADPARVKPCTSADFPSKVARPAYSVLSDTAWREAGLTPLRSWEDALKAYFAKA